MTRSQYVTAIWMYEKRRYEMRQKYGMRNPIYGEKVKGITTKIKNWKGTIRRIDRRNKLIINLVKEVNKYFSVDIKSRKLDNLHKLARNIYYKIGLEMGIGGIYISEHIGRDKRRAVEGRQYFTRSFKKNKENQETFYRFKKHLNNKI